ncbi:hypothetical protein LCGC14_3081000, partial [marine sediment metagenome]
LVIVVGVYKEAGFYTGLLALLTLIAIEIILENLKIIKEIGRLCVGKPSRYDSEQIEKIRKLCLKQIDTFNTDKLKEGENAKKS